jgi:hypothetical protein
MRKETPVLFAGLSQSAGNSNIFISNHRNIFAGK